MASGTPRIMSQEAKVCGEVVEVEVRQGCARTGLLKGVPDVIPPVPYYIVKHSQNILSGSLLAEQAPQGFIEWQRSCLSILGLLQQDKSVRHVHHVPGEA